MTNGTSVLPVGDLPRALWVTAASVYEVPHKAPAVEWPKTYRLGFESPLVPAEYAAFLHHMNEQPLVEQIRLHHVAPNVAFPLVKGSLTVDQYDFAGASQIFEITVSEPKQHRAAIRQIKQVARPVQPYTAFTSVSSQRLPGNSARAWVVIRDELDAAEQSALARALERLREVHLVSLCGRSTFELRLDARPASDAVRFAKLLAPCGIRHDFYLEMAANSFKEAVNPKADM